MQQFLGNFGEWKRVITDAGDETWFSEFFNEACHSQAGAVEETLCYYIAGTEICERENRSQENRMCEVGFGFGLAFALTYQCLKQPFFYTAFEMEEKLIEVAQIKYPKIPCLQNLKATADGYQGIDSHCHLKILTGNARDSIKQLENESFTAIYQDPFGPQKNPDLWTVEWFEALKTHSNAEVRLATYSASSSVRKSLLAAGWSIANMQGYGRKKISTTATLVGQTDEEILKQLRRSPVPALIDGDLYKFDKALMNHKR